MKAASPWLRELYRQWHANRGRKLQPGKLAFFRPWEDLLKAAGLETAAEKNCAVQEAEALEKEGHVVLVRHRYRRYLIESIALPVEAESWLLNLCGGVSARELCECATESIRLALQSPHPRWPESWLGLCETLLSTFAEGKNLPPFFWHDPSEVSVLLEVLRGLTSREWGANTLVRDASATLGLDSKFLEKKTVSLEAALGLLFGEPTTLESLGLSLSQSHVTLHGPLTLHFPDGPDQTFAPLVGEYSISAADLIRASRASTTAGQILSIENAKTTFRQAVARNVRGDTLIVASSYPTMATRCLLELLPFAIPHYHFGDTDVSGFAILRSLRAQGLRPVRAFQMDWRDQENSLPLSEHDRRLLPGLLQSAAMKDCRPQLLAMQQAGRKGAFEQELRGSPVLFGWPFWAPESPKS